MTDFFCNIYSSIRDRNEFLKRVRFYSLLRVLTRLSANLLLPIYYQCTRRNSRYALKPSEKKEEQLIVSLTSFPARINKVWIVIECMLRQTVQPDRIILWLSKEQFKDMTSIPKNLIKLQSRGLEIQIVDGDLRSHKKYFYAMKYYPEASIITIDDDVFYHSNTLKWLLDTHSVYPNDVIANIAHQIQFDSLGYELPYNDWKSNIQIPNYAEYIFQVGIGGVLYPKHACYRDVCEPIHFCKYCPYGDDIWLYSMCKIQGTTIRTSSSSFTPLPIYNFRNQSLSRSNLQGGNDVQIKQVTDYCIKQYGVNPFAQ